MSKRKATHLKASLLDDGVGVDLVDRIATLDALKAGITARLTAVSLPVEQTKLAEHLEKIAEETYDKAQRIRKQLATDSTQVDQLINECDRIDFEIAACRACQNNKLQPTRAMLQRLVAEFAKQRSHRLIALFGLMQSDVIKPE